MRRGYSAFNGTATKAERLSARQYQQERKEQRAEARRAAKADRIARGETGAPVGYAYGRHELAPDLAAAEDHPEHEGLARTLSSGAPR